MIALDRTLILLIEHKDMMFKMIDYMDEHQLYEIQIEVFIHTFKTKLNSLNEKKDKDRLTEAFSKENLMKTGIISEWNKSGNFIAFQPTILEIFRLFDKERMRGLRKPELEKIRVQLKAVYDQHKTLNFDIANPDFKENRQSLFLLLREISSQIDNNVQYLEYEVERLSKRLDTDNEILTLDKSQQIKKTLSEITDIYDRQIIPLLEFLNTHENSKVKSPLTLIKDISALYDMYGYENDAHYIQQYGLSITTYYKPIEKVKQSLQRYIHQERQQRLIYNAIEQAYLNLQELIKKTTTENLKDKYIFKSFNEYKLYFKGLKTHSAAQGAKIKWYERNHAFYFKEYLIEKNARKRSNDISPPVKINQQNLINPNDILKRKIRMLVKKCDIKPPVDDIYIELHHLFVENLQADYQLQYLLYGVNYFKQLKKCKLQVRFERPQRKIEHNNKALEYNKREFIL
jgi:hypothetical protein